MALKSFGLGDMPLVGPTILRSIFHDSDNNSSEEKQ